ncbi:hypothetical protein [Hymenobacter tenuis]
MSKLPLEKTPTQLFDLLVELLLAEEMPQPVVARRLQPFIAAARLVPEQLGRTYYIMQGPYGQLTATFEKPSFRLYQVTARLVPAAYAQIKEHAQALPAGPAWASRWENKWLGLWPRLVVSSNGTVRKSVKARFLGLLPKQKFIVLTRG